MTIPAGIIAVPAGNRSNRPKQAIFRLAPDVGASS